MSLLDHLRNLCKVGGDQVTRTIVKYSSTGVKKGLLHVPLVLRVQIPAKPGATGTGFSRGPKKATRTRTRRDPYPRHCLPGPGIPVVSPGFGGHVCRVACFVCLVGVSVCLVCLVLPFFTLSERFFPRGPRGGATWCEVKKGPPTVLVVRSAVSLVDENNLSTLWCETGGGH